MKTESNEPWPCDWAGHELQQLRREAAQSFRDHLLWLEEATEFAEKLKGAPILREGVPPYGEKGERQEQAPA